ncbi:hypothetical protein JOB18_026460 [Solea senegalensis]|uniref:Uncharacterized protein n=1 Tax=Solea senegalensis TaxID=28829 RepID=A0AAV6SGZ9_SOLSE|nr:hypothetical protein JOB18_026460 [Solea senegalensis]
MNKNGERFTDLCALNQLVIGSSTFMHKQIHKATWRSPDCITENQIDHICISQKFRRLWSDELFKEEDTDIEDQWQQTKKGWLDTCEEVLGKNKPQHKEWISFSTLQKLEARKQKKASASG